MSTRARSHSNRGHGLKLATCAVSLLALGASEPLRERAGPFRGSGIGSPIAGTLACPDADADGFADCAVAGCDATGLTCGDCDDANTDVNPGAAEICNHADDDCDGLADEDFSQTTYVSVRSPMDPAGFGWSVAGVGDVTSDGIEDFVTGVIRDDHGNAGSVLLYSGATRSIVCRAVDPSPSTGDQLGYVVAAVPDMNVDGRQDFLAGVPFYDDVAIDGGSVFLFSGANCAVIRQYMDPSRRSFDRFGSSVGWVADLTMDGVPEILVGSPGADPAGVVVVFNGATGAVVRRLNDSAGLGRSVASPGDVDSDDVPDIAAGTADGVQVYSGADFSPIYMASDASAPGIGYSLAALDDIDADGVNDLASGSPNGAGIVVLFSGVDGALIDRLTDPLGEDGDELGHSLAAVPDLTGDGLEEIATVSGIGSPGDPNPGKAFIFDPSTGEIVATPLVDPAGDRLAEGVSSADVTGDGAPEILIGGPDAAKVVIVSFESDCDGDGVTALGGDCDDADASNYSGNTEVCDAQDNDCDMEVDVDDDDGDAFGVCDDCDLSNPLIFPGAAEACNGVDDDCDATADDGPDGDLDGVEAPCDCDDGDAAVFPDAPEVCNHADDNCGLVDEGFSQPITSVSVRDTVQGRPGDQFGWSVAGMGDVTGDGAEDFVIGVVRDNLGAVVDAGSVLLYSGATRSIVCRAVDFYPVPLDRLGYAVAAVPDMNMDGKQDFLAGAPLDDTVLDGGGTVQDGGIVLLFSGANCAVMRQYKDPSARDQLGYSVGWVADLTMDGIPEILAGAPYNNTGRNDAGIVVVFDGATGAVIRRLSDPQAQISDGLGSSVTGLGDVDFDRVPDIAASARLRGFTYVFSGADGSLLYRASSQPGSPVIAVDDIDRDGVSDIAAGWPHSFAGSVAVLSGRDGSRIRVMSDPSGEINDELGHSLAAIPDLTGDGLREIVAGAWFSNPQGSNSGSATIFDPSTGAIVGTELVDPAGAAVDRLGQSVSFADVTGDGDPEILIGAFLAENGADTDVGKVVIVSFESDCDGDGVSPFGGDCDDTDPGTPSVEVADDGIDQDCDGFDTVTCFVDGDQDGFGSTATTMAPDGSCDTDEGESNVDTDCNDTDAAINPAAPEICDLLDNDCNGAADEGPDSDGDGFTTCGGDCDDSDADSFPGGVEACDGADNDCNGAPGADETDGDLDGYRVCGGDCNDADSGINPTAEEICDLLDNNCDGAADEGFDNDGDGFTTCGGDCDDDNGNRFPGAAEVCDGADDDCDGSLPASEADVDGDGFPTCAGDCDDSDGGSSPAGVEACDGADNDCSGSVPAEEADADADGFRVCDLDCDDGDGTINFDAPEICDDLIDNDCDTEIDGADLDCALAVTTCSTLGDSAEAIDQDIWTLTGTQGETVTIDLAASGVGTGTVNLYLADDVGAGFFLVDRGELPSRIVAILPATGAYRVAVVQQPKMAFVPGARFAGNYCLAVEGDQGAAATLVPTASVESTIPATGPIPPDPGGNPPSSRRTPFNRSFD